MDPSRVVGLIMVGTPNHGSELARFRVFGEIRDQWVNLVKARGHILGSILDGAGEAKIDLLPQSQFLRTLNGRPHPEGVEMLVIAGVVTPWDASDVDRFLSSIRKNAPDEEKRILVELEAFLQSTSDGLGDGLVTVESTRLDGAERRTVPGTHLSMIRNMLEGGSRIPPYASHLPHRDAPSVCTVSCFGQGRGSRRGRGSFWTDTYIVILSENIESRQMIIPCLDSSDTKLAPPALLMYIHAPEAVLGIRFS